MIDRLAYWYYHPREWLKKVALMNDVYLLNSPFTFQAMEKHSTYCALIRLGMRVPETVLVPHKNPIDNVRWAYTARHYNDAFDLPSIAEQMGYPLFMKPFDGGGWRGVSKIDGPDELQAAYDQSGEMLMHLQKAVLPFDVFARALTIGPDAKVMHFRPDEPMHDRYQVGGDVFPIDYANACPDVALTSLHYYFPWAMKSLVSWTLFCALTGRKARLHVDSDPWFAVADDDSLDYQDKLTRYEQLADAHFDTDRYREFCAQVLPHLDDVVYEWVTSQQFDRMLTDTIQATYPEHERDRFTAHFKGLMQLWIDDESAVRGSPAG